MEEEEEEGKRGCEFVCVCVFVLRECVGGDRERCCGHLTHLLKPMSTLLSLAVLIGRTNQVEGSSAVSGANTLRVTNILLTGGRRVTLAVSPEDPAGTCSASRKRPSY